ncbi:hypothetical protein CDD81_5363 [Ophiocordyceps australis]|uniref:Uncharacterized protein n=1 Tax=Ophiocordyceps australis TaxID=1399860 RepID=A0A2C5Y361_9HYPO|nr:hypothetical protein CDD81_5363 [Ophiocordyceps australis]
MGACSSCLGRRDNDDYDENEESRLLYDEGGAYPYGSFGDVPGGDETLEEQREMDHLQNVIAQTSNKMFDIYENGLTIVDDAYSYAANPHSSRYHCLLSKLGNSTDEEPVIHVEWTDEGDDGQTSGKRANMIKTVDHDAFVGAFDNAATAIEY